MSSIRRAVQVLDLLAGKGALGVRGSAKLKLPVGSAHRLLIDLSEAHAVELFVVVMAMPVGELPGPLLGALDDIFFG